MTGKQYELKIPILEKEYLDNLIIALVHQGFSPYINSEGGVTTLYISICDSDMHEIKT